SRKEDAHDRQSRLHRGGMGARTRRTADRGPIVALSASSGGSFRESWAIAKVYAEARKERGASQLLDDLVAENPKPKRYDSVEEAETQGLERLREAVVVLEQKASPGEVA